ncbi:6-phosphogluconolactonase [Litoreibacter albidus]|uniref:6-phosphogluconolactonase n=1 Tax=Litoreibacter albidus TaxID=670155 RepID=A0A1H2SYJ9_9RHOB|nr:6-phosphogluconolactonase [Litoreibacter albidus]SDW36678.1 6-phosphogluconolactonase [Litoreibacter albidus]
MEFIEYPDRDLMMIDLANHLAGELNEALMTHDQASIAVPGGSTPGPVFDALCAADIDWSRVTILVGDERRVPADHERSNERMIRARLLTSRAAAANYVSIRPDGETLPDISAHLPLSVLVVGMGADMHTASLFPGSADLEAALADDAPDLMLVEAADGLEPRITMTGRVLSEAMSTHVLIAGQEKRDALEQAANFTRMEAPIRTVLANATVHWAP